jgi:phospholipid transport system substrate-binding protein
MPTPRSLAFILTLALAVPAVGLASRADAKVAKAAKDKPAKNEKALAEKTPPKAEKADPAGQPAAAAATPPPGSPMAELKKSNAQLDKVLHKNVPNWTPEAELEREEVRKLVGGFLDYGELARRSLARHWDNITPKQRAEFTETLRQLVERSYLKQVHGSPNYNIKYEKEEKTGNEAVVDAALHTTSRGKKVDIALQYKMIGKDGKWVVYDVITDEQSMLENYRAEFNKIITKDGFDALVKRMKKKLEEKEE